MRLNIVIVVSLVMLTASCKGQSIIVQKKDGMFVNLPDFYSKTGVILKQQPSLDVFQKLNYASYYNPTDSDILRTETIFKATYIALVNERDGNRSFDSVKDKDLYKEWRRQYLPFINKNSEKIIFVTMLKCCHSNVSKCYPDWKKEVAFTLGDGMCMGEARFIMNLTQNKLKLF